MYARCSKSIDNSNFRKNKITSSKSEIIGDFRIGAKIGQGTFSKVCQGIHIPTGEKVAIKIIPKNQIKDRNDKIRIEKEICLQKKLHHQNIIQQYSILETELNIYIITEYCSGGELFDYIVSKRKLNENESCRIYQQLISGLEYMHKLKICHRDLKPENLLFDSKHNLKICDFGLSKDYINGKLSTPCGSPCYSAPEMVTGKKYLGSTVDIWSSGIVLFSMVCGYLPFEDENQSLLFKKIAKGLFSLPSYLSPACKDLIKKILITDPEKRYNFDKIKQHPWFNSVNGIFCKNIFFNSPGVLIEKDILPIDACIIIEIYYKYKCNIKNIVHDIVKNKHNKISTTYYLILKRKIRNNEESISDLSPNSKLFTKYIKMPISKMEYWNNDYEKIIDYYTNLINNAINKEKNGNNINEIIFNACKEKNYRNNYYNKNKKAFTEANISDNNENNNTNNDKIIITTVGNNNKISPKEECDFLVEEENKSKNYLVSNFNKVEDLIKKNKKEQLEKSNEDFFRRNNYELDTEGPMINDIQESINQKPFFRLMTNNDETIDNNLSTKNENNKEILFSIPSTIVTDENIKEKAKDTNNEKVKTKKFVPKNLIPIKVEEDLNEGNEETTKNDITVSKGKTPKNNRYEKENICITRNKKNEMNINKNYSIKINRTSAKKNNSIRGSDKIMKFINKRPSNISNSNHKEKITTNSLNNDNLSSIKEIPKMKIDEIKIYKKHKKSASQDNKDIYSPFGEDEKKIKYRKLELQYNNYTKKIAKKNVFKNKNSSISSKNNPNRRYEKYISIKNKDHPNMKINIQNGNHKHIKNHSMILEYDKKNYNELNPILPNEIQTRCNQYNKYAEKIRVKTNSISNHTHNNSSVSSIGNGNYIYKRIRVNIYNLYNNSMEKMSHMSNYSKINNSKSNSVEIKNNININNFKKINKNPKHNEAFLNSFVNEKYSINTHKYIYHKKFIRFNKPKNHSLDIQNRCQNKIGIIQNYQKNLSNIMSSNANGVNASQISLKAFKKKNIKTNSNNLSSSPNITYHLNNLNIYNLYHLQNNVNSSDILTQNQQQIIDIQNKIPLTVCCNKNYSKIKEVIENFLKKKYKIGNNNSEYVNVSNYYCNNKNNNDNIYKLYVNVYNMNFILMVSKFNEVQNYYLVKANLLKGHKLLFKDLFEHMKNELVR